MRFTQIDGSTVKKLMATQGIESSETAAFSTLEGHTVIHSIDTTPHGKLRHVSIAHPKRLPDWYELKETKYHFFKEGEDAVILLPRTTDGIKYVDFHKNCIHLWQLPRIPGMSGKWEVE